MDLEISLHVAHLSHAADCSSAVVYGTLLSAFTVVFLIRRDPRGNGVKLHLIIAMNQYVAHPRSATTLVRFVPPRDSQFDKVIGHGLQVWGSTKNAIAPSHSVTNPLLEAVCRVLRGWPGYEHPRSD